MPRHIHYIQKSPQLKTRESHFLLFGSWNLVRSSHPECSVEEVFLEISQNSQENTYARVSFFINVAGLRAATLLKRDSGTDIFM